MNVIGQLKNFQAPPVRHKFLVTFLMGGLVPNPIDVGFQSVRGLKATVGTETVSEGGQNLYGHKLPNPVEYGNLILERGKQLVSPVSMEFNKTMSFFDFFTGNVLVVLMDEKAGISFFPVAAWLFVNTYPVNWSFSDLDATSNEFVIETLELAYQRMQVISL